MKNLTLSVSQLNNYIKNIFEVEEFLIGISVFGEMSNFKISGNYAYFDLKDEASQISCVMFNLSNMAKVQNGDKVLVTGRMNFHTKLGKLSFVANKIELYGVGELYKKYLELKDTLQKEGVFDEKYKIPLPKYAKRVGVITSETGAVIHDIINVTKRKNPYTDLVLYPVKVQGEGADKEIARAIYEMDRREDLDVLILARGGGSFEDLAPFNTETVARSVFACHKPIISAVGHETDFSLSDFAADMRAPTPSVGAELAVYDFSATKDRLVKTLKRCSIGLSNRYEREISKLKSKLSYMFNYIEKESNASKNKITKNCRRIENKVSQMYLLKYKDIEKYASVLDKQNPIKLIQKGFSRMSFDGKTVQSVKQVKVGNVLVNSILDGDIYSQVTEIKNKGESI